MSNPINVIVQFDASIPTHFERHLHGWWLCVSTGEWDTYVEVLYLLPTKPTARQLRQAVKAFKLEHIPKCINF